MQKLAGCVLKKSVAGACSVPHWRRADDASPTDSWEGSGCMACSVALRVFNCRGFQSDKRGHFILSLVSLPVASCVHH